MTIDISSLQLSN